MSATARLLSFFTRFFLTRFFLARLFLPFFYVWIFLCVECLISDTWYRLRVRRVYLVAFLSFFFLVFRFVLVFSLAGESPLPSAPKT